MEKFKLENDEVIILSFEDVERGSSGSGSKMLGKTGNRGDLFLTNHRLVFIVESGLFKKTVDVVDFSLEAVKVYNGLAQIKASKPEGGGYPYPIDVFFSDSHEIFYLPSKYKKSIGNLIESVNEILTGERVGFNPKDIGQWGIGSKLKRANVAETIGGAIGSVKPITANVADVVSPFVPAAAAIASARGAGVTGAAGMIIDVISHQTGMGQGEEESDNEQCAQNSASSDSSTGSANAGIDDQVEAILSLKKLLDAGILTQEEFDAKKKQLLGI